MASVAKRKWTHSGAAKEAWVVRWKDAGGHRSRQFEKKKDADRYRQEIEASTLAGRLATNAAPTTLAKFCDDWLASRERLVREGRLARSTFERETYQTTKHIVRLLGSVRLDEMRANHVDEFIRMLAGWKNKSMPGNLSSGTVRKVTTTLGQILDHAKRRGLVGQNVARDVLAWPEHRAGGRRPIRTLTVEEVRRILRALEMPRPYTMQRSMDLSRATIYLAAFCGLRFGEVFGLTRDSFDFPRRLVRVRHSLDAWDNLKGPKTRAGVRDVPMPDPVADALERWGPHYVDNTRGLLFRSRSGSRIQPANFHRDCWRPVVDAAGLGPDAVGEYIHFHALRHFFASAMVEAHVPDADVARLLGHSNFDTTLRIYTHSTRERDHRHIAPDVMATALLAPPVAQELRTAA